MSQYGNTVVIIDPASASIESSVLVGSEPGKLALSDDDEVLYVGLDGANAVRRTARGALHAIQGASRSAQRGFQAANRRSGLSFPIRGAWG